MIRFWCIALRPYTNPKTPARHHSLTSVYPMRDAYQPLPPPSSPPRTKLVPPPTAFPPSRTELGLLEACAAAVCCCCILSDGRCWPPFSICC
uniref:Cysteine-rich transmembrane CYSTM domain-containing protein n=1 Tax=Kalanchoe fedtschenkoi TaxID=63787 RepID=A0A7N0ZRK6_KALFE